MTDLQLDPAVVKLIEYAKGKKILSYDELSDFLPEHIVNTDKMDGVLALLEANNVQLIEEEPSGDDESEHEQYEGDDQHPSRIRGRRSRWSGRGRPRSTLVGGNRRQPSR